MNSSDLLLQSMAQQSSAYDVSFQPRLHQATPDDVRGADKAFWSLLSAREMTNQAASYRGFNVGAIAVAVSDSGIVSWRSGFNVKPDSNGDVNIHAEDLAIEKITRPKKLGHIALLAICGLPLEDSESGLKPTTLHPCQRCRSKLDDNELFLSDTPIVSTTPNGSAISYGLLRDYIDYHRSDTHNLQTLSFDQPLQLFAALSTSISESDADEKAWTDDFVIPYMKWLWQKKQTA